MTTEQNTQDFLKALLAPDNDVRQKVPMKRFGLDFEVRALEPDEVSKITQRSTRLTGKKEKVFNEDMFNYLTIAAACVTPNWEDEALHEALGVHDAIGAIKKRLLFGEVAQLLGVIGDLNGFNQTDEEMIEEIKN